MTNISDRSTRTTKWIRWIARVWGTIILVIVLLIAIGSLLNAGNPGAADPNAVGDHPPIENLPPIFILLSAVGLGIAWRWEAVGGAIAVLFQLVMLPVLLIHWPLTQDTLFYLVAPYGISALVAIPGILFLVCWWRSRRIPVK